MSEYIYLIKQEFGELKIKPLVKATLIITIITICTRAVGFLYRVYLSRLLGPEGIGIYQIALSIFSVLITITSSGIPTTVSRKSAQYYVLKDDKSADSLVTSAAVFTFIIASVFCLLILIFDNLFAFVFTDKRCMPVFMMLLPAFLSSSIYSAFRGGLWGKKAYVAYSIVELAEELILVGSGLLLTLSVDTIAKKTLSAAAAISISYTVAAIITVIIYLKRGGKFRKPKGQLAPLLKSAAPVTGVRLSSNILNSIIALIFPMMLTILGGLTKSEALAEFGIISGMTLPLLFLPSTVVGSLSLVLVPEISQNITLKNNEEVKKRIDSALNFALAVALIIIPAFIACGKEFGIFLYNNEKPGNYLQYFSILMAPMCLSAISTSVCNSMGKEYITLRNFLIGAALMLICILALPGVLGVYALMLGQLLSLTITSVLNIICIKKSAGISFKFLKNGFALFLAGFFVVFLGKNIQGILNSLKLPDIFVALTMIVCMVIMIFLSILFGILDIKLILPKKKKPIEKTA